MKTKLKFLTGIFALSIVCFTVYKVYAWSHPDSEIDHLDVVSQRTDTYGSPIYEYTTHITYQVMDQYDEPITGETGMSWDESNTIYCQKYYIKDWEWGGGGINIFGQFTDNLRIYYPPQIPSDFHSMVTQFIDVKYEASSYGMGWYCQTYWGTYAEAPSGMCSGYCW